MPWNQETPLGYFFEICISLICMESYLIDNGAFLLLFISICLHHWAFYKMFQKSLKALDRHDNIRKTKEHIHHLVEFYILIKEWVWQRNAEHFNLNYSNAFSFPSWFLESAKVYSHIVLIQLACSMLFLSCILFQLDLVIILLI